MNQNDKKSMLNLHSPEDAVEKMYKNPIDLALLTLLTTGRDSFIFNVYNFMKIIEASLNSFL